MKILFDGTSIFEDLKMGLSTYSYEIVKNIYLADPTNQYFVGVRTSRWKSIHKLDVNVKIEKLLSLSIGGDFLPLAFSPNKFDIYHGLANRLCFGIIAKKYILTLHDTHGRKKKLKKMCNLADLVITISNFSKRSIVEELGIPEKKIKVIYNGVSDIFTKKDQNYVSEKKKEFKSKYGGDRFILCVITDDTQRNIRNILFTITNITQKYKGVKAIFVGKDISEYIQTDKNNIINIGYVSKEKLCDLYNISDMLFFPATYGGFGLPVVEAMACGCPVLTSRGTAQDEIGDEAAEKCDPYSVDEMIEKMEKIISSPSLQQKLSEKGLERAKFFSWKKAAQQILETYREVMK